MTDTHLNSLQREWCQQDDETEGSPALIPSPDNSDLVAILRRNVPLWELGFWIGDCELKSCPKARKALRTEPNCVVPATDQERAHPPGLSYTLWPWPGPCNGPRSGSVLWLRPHSAVIWKPPESSSPHSVSRSILKWPCHWAPVPRLQSRNSLASRETIGRHAYLGLWKEANRPPSDSRS